MVLGAGESRADVMLRAPAPMEATPEGERARPLRVPRMEMTLETGPKANRVTIRTAAGDQVVDVPANDRRTVVVEMGPGLPYKPYPENPTNYVYAHLDRQHGRLHPAVRDRRPRQPLPRRQRADDAALRVGGRRVRIAVVTSSPPFVEGGHLVIARELVRACRRPATTPTWSSRRRTASDGRAPPISPPG